MRNHRNISAVLFAFLLAGVIGVGTAQAQDINLKNCGTEENQDWSYNEKCNFNGSGGKGSQTVNQSNEVNTASSTSTQTQSYTQSQPATQTDQQAAPEPKEEKSAADKSKTDDSDEVATTADVAGATDEPQPFLPLWALLGIAGTASIYAFSMRRLTAFWQKA